MGKVLNFDKFIQEKNNEKIKVTVYGKEYEILSRIPASVPVMMARAENDDGTLATKLVMTAADRMFGTKAVDEFCENGMSATELATLVKKLFSMINNDEDNDDDDSEELTDEDGKKVVKKGNEKK